MASRDREYRYGLKIPRDVNKNLETLVREAKEKSRRDVSKGDVIIEILRDFFAKNST